MTFTRAADSYLEVQPRSKATVNFLLRVTRFLGPDTICQDIDQAKIDAACRVLCERDAKPATKHRNVVTPIRSVLSHAARRGWCTAPNFEGAPVSKARTDWLSPAEAELMLGACRKRLAHMRPILAFLFCTGARVGEMVALELPDLDLPNGRALLRDTKNGQDRLVELPPRAVAELATMLGNRHRPSKRALRASAPERPAVFLDRARRPYRLTDDGKAGGYGGQIKRGWASVLKAAGIERAVTPHHARHTWATWHYCVHRDLLLLKQDGGWNSASQVERYAKLMAPAMAPSVLRFWGVSVVETERGRERG